MDNEVDSTGALNQLSISRSRSSSVSIAKRLRPRQPKKQTYNEESKDVQTVIPRKRVLADFSKMQEDKRHSRSKTNSEQNEDEEQQVQEEPSTTLPNVVPKAKSHGVEVKIINGQIVVDSASLNRQVNNYEFVDDDSTNNGSGYKKKQLKTKRWSYDDTKKFYNCLLQCGTNFSLINKFFPDRERKEIKNKFKNEEKRKPELIAMYLHGHVQEKLDIEKIREIENETAATKGTDMSHQTSSNDSTVSDPSLLTTSDTTTSATTTTTTINGKTDKQQNSISSPSIKPSKTISTSSTPTPSVNQSNSLSLSQLLSQSIPATPTNTQVTQPSQNSTKENDLSMNISDILAKKKQDTTVSTPEEEQESVNSLSEEEQTFTYRSDYLDELDMASDEDYY